MGLAKHFRDDLQTRVPWAALAMGVFFALLFARLIILQCVDGAQYREFAAGHGIRAERLSAERGWLLDRNGAPLVRNQPQYDVVAIPQYVADAPRVAQSLTELLQLDPAFVSHRLSQHRTTAAFAPLSLKTAATADDIAHVLAWQSPWTDASSRYDLRGVEIRTRFRRAYTDGQFAPHLLGYLQSIPPHALTARNAQQPDRYAAGDLIGAGGVEAAWDAWLRGHDGQMERIVDARGHETARPPWMPLSWQRPTAGVSLRLTIDPVTQRAARDAMTGHEGAVVALDPASGAVLAMVSAPEYDLNRLTGANRRDYWTELLNDPRKPLFARAVQGVFPPGSIYKMVVAAAALGEHLLDPNETITCHGSVQIGSRTFGCWNHGGHGAMNLRQALEQSCDVFFYQMGRRLGPDVIARYAARFGLGTATHVGLPAESAGLIPTIDWKRTARQRAWSEGDTLSIAIGQGYDLVTPLQAATMMATIANGGFRVHPYLIDEILGDAPDRADIPGQRFIGAPEMVVPADDVAKIQEGLVDVVEGSHGTAGRLKALQLKIAGKTGTAQVISVLRTQGIHSFNDHAWFVAFAPYDAPKIAVAVLVEHGGHGGVAAAPVAAQVIAAFFSEHNAK